MMNIENNSNYTSWLREIKEKISRAQIRAALAANRELILFYWDLGQSITQKLQENAWGNKVIERLSKDLSSEFPGIQGFSRRNLYYMKKFHEYFSEFSGVGKIVPPAGAQLKNQIVPPTYHQHRPDRFEFPCHLPPPAF